MMKGQVLHRARAHLKVPGCSLLWKALLTKKLPMFLSRLNEINGGCEKILEWNYVIILLLRPLQSWLPINLFGVMMACLNNRGRIATFVEKLAHFLDRKIEIRPFWGPCRPRRPRCRCLNALIYTVAP